MSDDRLPHAHLTGDDFDEADRLFDFLEDPWDDDPARWQDARERYEELINDAS